MKRLVLVTDAWLPQTNGVVTTLSTVVAKLPELGWKTHVIHPGEFRTGPLPGYREIRLVLNPWRVALRLDELAPDAIHIATEGPLGLMARRYCVRRGIPFSTSLHTKFPEYVEARLGLPVSMGYRFMAWFHNQAHVTLCTTLSHRQELQAHGLTKLHVWGRGVDLSRFKPCSGRPSRSQPVLLYVGRVAVEKNLEAFLQLPNLGLKRVVGDGPARAALQAKYPEVEWVGYRHGAELVSAYADADVLVFPSRTDTFGLVMLEAMACGTPVAAYPVTGPIDVVRNGENGWLLEDLSEAVVRALMVPRESCRASAEQFDWTGIARRFADALVEGPRQPSFDSMRVGAG